MFVHNSLNKRNIEALKFLAEARSIFDTRMTIIHFTICVYWLNKPSNDQMSVAQLLNPTQIIERNSNKH